MNKKLNPNIAKYLICFGVMALITLIMLLSGKIWNMTTAQKYSALSDAFAVPGMLALLVGLMIWVSSKGVFDPLGFGIKIALGGFKAFRRDERYERYYDYKARKEQKRLTGYGFLVIMGAVFILLGVVFSMLVFKAY